MGNISPSLSKANEELPPNADFKPSSSASSSTFHAIDESELGEDVRSNSEFEIRRNKKSESPANDGDDISLVSLPANLPPSPDGRWGWVIVFASFVANMIVDGIAYSFGLYLDTFSTYFDQPKGKVAWIGSLQTGLCLFVGPVVSSLTNKYGCRPVCIVGAIISAIGFASTIFATSVPYLMVTQGVFVGCGFGLIYLPSVVCVSYYFEKKRSMATGIAVCGSGVGTIVFPPMVNLLIENFGWQGTNLILAGIILNVCVTGALMRPLKVPKMLRKDLLHRIAGERKIIMENSSRYGSFYMNVQKSEGNFGKRVLSGKGLNFDPGVHSHQSFSEYMTPDSPALSRIKETNSKPKTFMDSPNEDEQSNGPNCTKYSFLERSSIKSPRKRTVSESSENSAEDNYPRNYSHLSQLSINKFRRHLSKKASVLSFEMKPSVLQFMNHVKIVPAITDAACTNSQALVSQMRNSPKHAVFAGSDIDIGSGNVRKRYKSEECMVVLPPLSRQDIFFSGSIKNLDEFKSQRSLVSYRESTFNLPNAGASAVVLQAINDAIEEIEVDEDYVQSKKWCPEDFCAPFRQMTNFSFLKNPLFIVLGFANLIGLLGFYTPYVYLPSLAIEKGIDKDLTAFIVSIIGITNTIGRVLSGLIADFPQVNALWVNNVALFLSGFCLFLAPFATSFWMFVIIAIFFGLFIAAFVSLTSIILVDLFGLESLTNAFGLLITFRGLASLVGPPLAGSIYDVTKSYDISFFTSGILFFICSLLHSLIPCCRKLCSSSEKKGMVRYHTNEEFLQAIPEEDIEECESLANIDNDDEGAGIVFDIKPKTKINDSIEDETA